MQQRSPIVSVRVNSTEREILELAAKQAKTSLSDYVRKRALEAAELAVCEYRIVTIPAENWEKFEAWANAPAREVPALRQLATTPPVWQE